MVILISYIDIGAYDLNNAWLCLDRDWNISGFLKSAIFYWWWSIEPDNISVSSSFSYQWYWHRGMWCEIALIVTQINGYLHRLHLFAQSLKIESHHNHSDETDEANFRWLHQSHHCDNDTFVGTGGSVRYHNDNPRYHQWRQSSYHDISMFSVIVCFMLHVVIRHSVQLLWTRSMLQIYKPVIMMGSSRHRIVIII